MAANQGRPAWIWDRQLVDGGPCTLCSGTMSASGEWQVCRRCDTNPHTRPAESPRGPQPFRVGGGGTPPGPSLE